MVKGAQEGVEVVPMEVRCYEQQTSSMIQVKLDLFLFFFCVMIICVTFQCIEK